MLKSYVSRIKKKLDPKNQDNYFQRINSVSASNDVQEQQVMEMLTSFPHMIPQNKNKTHYKGFILIKGQYFFLDVQLPGTTQKSLEGTILNCEWKLKNILRNYDQLLSKRLCNSSKLVDFLHEFKRLVEEQLSGRCESDPDKPQAALYDLLVTQIQHVGWHRLIFVDQTFRQLHLVAEDRKQRKHFLKIHLQSKHPVDKPQCSVDLPKAFNFMWTTKSTLNDLLDQFCHHLDQYQDLWDNLDDLDNDTWILEPEKPSRADLHRRIALGNNTSVQITISMDHPRMFPECRFLGADHVINPLKAKLNTNLHKWDTNQMLLHNLNQVLEIKFPSPTETNKQDFSMECGICYAYRLGDEIPEQACDDARCGQPFHHSCLYEWLRSLPSFRQSFNIAFGECPYCSTPITMKTTR